MKNFAVLFALIFVLTSCAAPVATQPPTATPLPPTATSLPPTATPVPPTDTPAPTATNTPIPTPTDTPIPPTSASGETVLELVGQTGSKSLTMAELETLPYVEGQAGIKSSTGQITLPALYRGVPIAELAKLIGDFSPEFGVNVVAKDGYAMTMSYEQITTGDFIQYDPATGAEKKEKEPLTMILAYARDGQPIPAAEEGPLRLAIISEKNDQVTDGHWSVKWVNKIELKPLGAEWSLQLHGVIDREVDRNSFQSCSAPGCHQATWIDDKAQNWVGIPLYLLAGKMDDLIEHDGPAFNDYLAQVGWLLQIVATDG
jgi:DMSO/TMAO reductase YedYZ molybdopterin-dependent catalytic subunit